MAIQIASCLHVPPDMKIDCLVTDGDQSVKAEVSGDLLRTPILLQFLESFACRELASIRKLADERIARLSFHECGHGVLCLSADHGVDLPMTD